MTNILDSQKIGLMYFNCGDQTHANNLFSTTTSISDFAVFFLFFFQKRLKTCFFPGSPFFRFIFSHIISHSCVLQTKEGLAASLRKRPTAPSPSARCPPRPPPWPRSSPRGGPWHTRGSRPMAGHRGLRNQAVTKVLNIIPCSCFERIQPW